MSGLKRRRHKRVSMNTVESTVRSDGDLHGVWSLIDNVSMGGAFARSRFPLVEGTRVELELPDPSGGVLKIAGVVTSSVSPEVAARRFVAPGMGIKFDPLDKETLEKLERLVATVDPSAVPARPKKSAKPAEEQTDPRREMFDFTQRKELGEDPSATAATPVARPPDAAPARPSPKVPKLTAAPLEPVVAAPTPASTPAPAPAGAVPSRRASDRIPEPPAAKPAAKAPAKTAAPKPPPPEDDEHSLVGEVLPDEPPAEAAPAARPTRADAKGSGLMLRIQGILLDLGERQLELSHRKARILALQREKERLTAEVEEKKKKLETLRRGFHFAPP